MGSFFSEFKRRHIYRVAAAYAVVAWVLLQLVANVAPILELPPWVARALLLLLLVIGFPLAILLAWAREPEGDASQRAMTGGLVLVIALVAYQELAPADRTVVQSGVDATRAAANSPATALSIAVLPFSNLSSDPEQEFFSDGITEEITAALAKISDLRVVARTSAFQFKGENRDMRALGQQLGATHLIEGSVREAGTRVRITAQLINTGDGTHLWSENYARELTDIFAIQEEIATAIAGALRMPLGLVAGARLVSSRTIDTESYQQYLRAKPLVRAAAVGVPQVIEILQPVVVRNPDYAPAWALLAEAYVLMPTYRRDRPVAELRRIVEEFLPKGGVRRAAQFSSIPILRTDISHSAACTPGAGNISWPRRLFPRGSRSTPITHLA